MYVETEKTLAKADPVLEKIMAQIERPRVESTQDVFHDLMSCIIEQQIHYRSSKRIFAKALERADLETVTLENLHTLDKKSLSQIKLAKGKHETILAFSEYWSKCKLEFNKLTDDEVVKELLSIKGIGKWTIDMILLYTLNRPNIFPIDDFHLKQIMISLYGLNPKTKLKAQMLAVADKWGKQKSLAVLYLLDYKKAQQNIKAQ